jgi:hypothetical protein
VQARPRAQFGRRGGAVGSVVVGGVRGLVVGERVGGGWVSRSSRAGDGGRLRGEAEVVEDPLCHAAVGDEREDLQPRGAAGTFEDVDREDLPQELRPRTRQRGV